MPDDDEATSPAELAQLLASAKVAIESALEQLEADNPDLEVAGFAMEKYTFYTPALGKSSPRNLGKLKGGLAQAGDGHCRNFICGPGDFKLPQDKASG
jgi:hypothetical protein